MNVAICDNERKNIEDVKKHLAIYSKFEQITFDIQVYETPKDLLENAEGIEIVFLDVKIGKYSGIELGRELKEKYPHIILIYLTLYDVYLDDAFSVGAERFIRKPLEPQRFYRAVSDSINKIYSSSREIRVRNGSFVERVYTDDIIFVEIQHRRTKIVTVNGVYDSPHPMKYWREWLLESKFATPHNSFIVNLDYLTFYSRNHYVVLNDTYQLNIARTKSSEFNNCVFKHLNIK